MATQLKDVDFARPAPLRPARVVAVTADAVASVPVGTANLTLDETVVKTLTGDIVRIAHQVLSRAMYPAFLNWADTSVALATHHGTDAEGERRCSLYNAALDALGTVTAANEHDLAFKSYIHMIEATDSSCFGPIVVDAEDKTAAATLASSLVEDFVYLSPLPNLIEQLAEAAWEASGNTTAYSSRVGSIIIAGIERGRQAQEGNPEAADPLLQALFDHRAEHIRYGEAPDGKEDDDLHHAEFARIEDIYLRTPAHTPAGLLGKLHTVFRGLEDGAWADDALTDPGSSRFKDGLAKADMFTRMLWSAVEDAARMSNREPTGKAW